jgi:TPR repeat protein
MQKWRGLAVVACVVLGMSGAARADWADDVVAAHARGDYQAAITILKPRAEQGIAVAQNFLGFMYDNGQGVAQDYKAAVKWYTLAAEQGVAAAQNNLGRLYFSGQGVAQDYKTAAK